MQSVTVVPAALPVAAAQTPDPESVKDGQTVCLTVIQLPAAEPLHEATYGSGELKSLMLYLIGSPHMCAPDDVESPADAPSQTSNVPRHGL